MEQPQIFNSINFGLPMYTSTFFEHTSAGAAGSERGPLGNLANSTAAKSQPNSFMCPSALRSPFGSEQKDYAVNGGLSIVSGKCICPDRFDNTVMNGFTAVNSWPRIAEITDGTSNTIMLIEEDNYTDHSYIVYGKGGNPSSSSATLRRAMSTRPIAPTSTRVSRTSGTTAPRTATIPAGSTRRSPTAACGSSRTPSA